MKKTALSCLIGICFAFLPAVAQDTLYIQGPLQNYFRGDFDFTPTETIKTGVIFSAQESWDDIAYQMDAGDDALKIYGIAAGIITYPDYFSPISPSDEEMLMIEYYYGCLQDTTYDKVIESLRLYDTVGGTLRQIGHDLPVHIHTTPVAYYVNPGYPNDACPGEFVFPVYERYFNSPQTVSGIFYVGITSHCALPLSAEYAYVTHPVRRVFFYDPNNLNWHTYARLYIGETTSNHVHNTWYSFFDEYNYYFFPILTPPDTSHSADTTFVGGSVLVYDTLVIGGDTTVTVDTIHFSDITVGSDTLACGDTLVVSDTLVFGGDTIVVYDTLLSIMQGDLLQRLTGILPNPASATARAVSSIGITGLDVYALDGRLVYQQRIPAAPLTADLDVSSWPRGTYLVRIHTPMGTTTRKLTVM